MNFNLVLVFALFCGVSCQPTPAQNNDPALVAFSRELVATIKTFVDNFQYLVSSGVLNLAVPLDTTLFNTTLVTLPGNLVLDAGLTSLPVGYLCTSGVKVLETIVCYIAAADCTYVHNKYSGSCGSVADPIQGTAQTGNQVLICNEQNPNPGTQSFTDGVAQCGGVFNVSSIDNGIYQSIAYIARIRMRALLCQTVGPLVVSSQGCISDCRNNHNYANATCLTRATHVATLSGDTPVGVNCVCSDPHY
jgi:hypothetical protein